MVHLTGIESLRYTKIHSRQLCKLRKYMGKGKAKVDLSWLVRCNLAYSLCNWFLAHLSRRLVGELIVYPWSGVRPSSTISNMNISATSRPIATKFYLKRHWVGGKAVLGFGPDRIRTLVSRATESSHRVIMEKKVSPPFRDS